MTAHDFPVARRLPIPLATAQFLVLAMVSSAHAQCPNNQLSCAYTIVTSEPRRSCSYTDGLSGESAAYDLIAATFSADGWGSDVSGGGGLSATDRYTCSGVPASTSIILTGELHVTGEIPGGGGCSATNRSPPSGQISATLSNGSSQKHLEMYTGITCEPLGEYVYLCCTTGGRVDSTLRLTIDCVAGQPFEIRVAIGASAGSYGSSAISASLRFVGLPPGAMISSCQGYEQAAPTATRRASWGALKQLYR